jgi:hydroxymethylbilane synthase
VLDPYERPPAPGQGCLAIQTRTDDIDAPWVRALDHPPTRLAIAAERGALLALEGSCRTAMGAYTRTETDVLKLVVEALAPDGSARWREEDEVALSDGEAGAHALGLRLGQAVRAAGGDRLEL